MQLNRRHISSNFSLGLSIGYGRYSDIFSVKYSNQDLRNFREDGKFISAGYNGLFQNQSGYFCLGFLGSYRHVVKENSWIVLDIGLSKLFFTNKRNDLFTSALESGLDFQNQYKFGTFTWGTGNLGKGTSDPLLLEASVHYNFTNKRSRNFIIGLSVTISPHSSLNGQSSNESIILKDYKTDANGNILPTPSNINYGEQIIPQYTSIGLKLGMQLFKF